MKQYSQLADLESLLLNISDPTIRAYSQDAVNSYLAGAYRSSIVSIWIAVVYDLYQKIRYLKEQYNDRAAIACIKDIDEIRIDSDKKRISAWEHEILKKAHNDIKMITEIEYDHLVRIQQDRHRCAHPVLDNDGLLFQPLPELARTHIRTAIEILLSQPAIMNKAAVDALIRDVEESIYFPENDLEAVKNFLKNRHFLNHSDKYKKNIWVFSLKRILFDGSDDKRIIQRYILIFVATHQEFPDIFEKIEKKDIIKFFNSSKQSRYEDIALFLFNHSLKNLFDCIEDSYKEIFKAFITNHDSFGKDENLIRAMVGTYLQLYENDDLIEKYKTLDPSQKNRYLIELKKRDIFNNNLTLTDKLIEININCFTQSGSYAEAKMNSMLIEANIAHLSEKHIKTLLTEAVDKQKYKGFNHYHGNQLIVCKELFVTIFSSTFDKYPNTAKEWKYFSEYREFSYSFDELMKEKIEKVFEKTETA
jgi:hypothetical protein